MARGSNAHSPKRALMDHHRKKLVRKQKQHLLAIKTASQLREMRLATQVKQRKP